MRGSIVWTIFWKELRDTLRDRRTLVVMVLLPVVLYPVLILVLGQVTVSQQARLQERLIKVALAGEAHPELRSRIEKGKNLKLLAAPTPSAVSRMIRDKELDAAIEVPTGTSAALAAGQVATLFVACDDTRHESREGCRRLQRVLEKYRSELVKRTLRERNLPPGVAEPLEIKSRNVATPERMGASLLARTLPLLLVVMLILGAFYPAIDLTAGEKERGTLETLLTSPIRPVEIVTGKYLAVFCVAMISGVANLVAMGATITQGLPVLAPGAGIQFEITADRVALIFVALIPLGLLVSALMLAVAVLARSFKEAQNLLTPTYLLLVLPSMIASMPGMDLDPMTAFVPGLNATLLAKGILLGDAPANLTFAVLLANLAYTALALVFAARNFSNEAVLFGGPDARRWSWRPAPRAKGGRATPGQAFFFFGLLLVLLWYVAQGLQRWNLVGGLLLSQWGLLLVPALGYAAFLRLDLRATFRLRLPTVRGWTAAAVTGLALAVFVPFVVVPLQNLVLPVPTQLVESMKEFFQVGRTALGDVGVLVLVALTPAVCEEFVFRGLLLDGFRSRFSRGGTVLVVALLFGAFHISLYRFLPTAVAGGVIAWVVLETGSLFTGILMHALYNGVLFGAGIWLGTPLEIPVGWAAAGSVAGLALGLWLARRSSPGPAGPGAPAT